MERNEAGEESTGKTINCSFIPFSFFLSLSFLIIQCKII